MATAEPADGVARDRRGRRIGKRATAGNPHPLTVLEAVERGVLKPREEACPSCGKHHYSCSGHADIYDNGDYKTGVKVGERPCVHWAMKGQRVCATHGGKGRNRVRARAQWEKETKGAREMARLEKAVKTFGLPITTDPQQALLDEIARTAGHVKWLGEQIGELDINLLVWDKQSEERRTGVGEMETSIDLTTTVHQARPAVLVELYQKERAHLVHVAKVAIQCGIAERQIKLAEEQGQMIANVLREVFESPELELTVTQIQVARVVATRALRSISVQQRSPLDGHFQPKVLDGESHTVE